MSNPESSLPEAWVRKIFATMRATYGAAFDRQWQCPAASDPAEHAADMIGHWARELRGYQQSPQALAYALEHLPDNPPNLIEFRKLCRGAPQYTQRQIEAPRVTPEKMKEAVASIVSPPPREDEKQWARNLQALEERGGNLTLAQKTMWRAALNVGQPS